MLARIVERLSRLAPFVLYGAIIFGLGSGTIVALVWRIEEDWTVYQPPIGLTALGYLAAIGLATPGALWGAWQMLRGNWRQGWRKIFILLGAVLTFLGAELGSHYLLPCPLLEALNLGAPDWGIMSFDGRDAYMCPQIGTTLSPYVWSRIHLLHHTLLGGTPIALLYAFILQRTKSMA